MITLEKLAYQIISEVQGGQITQDTPLRINYVAQRIRQTLNEFLSLTLAENYSSGMLYGDPMYLATYKDIPVTDNQDGTGTLQIPEFFQQLPYNKGVHSISPFDNPTKTYKRRLNIGVSSGLPVNKMEGHVGWWQEGFTVYLKPMSKVKNKAIVKLLIAAPDTIELADPLPITADMQANLIKELVAEFRDKPVVDMTNDNNPNLTSNVG